MKRLSEDQIKEELANVPHWEQVADRWIERKFTFENYLASIKFVERIALYAEEQQHHPIIHIQYKVVTLKMSSWQQKSLTELDFKMATHFDQLYDRADK